MSKKDVRCVVVTYDLETAEQNFDIIKHITTKHQNCAGVYGAVLQERIVRKGDNVFVL